MIRAGVVGATGYTGAELVRLISGHPDVELTIVTSRQYSGKPFVEIYPSMEGMINLVCESMSLDVICDKTDVVLIALPHKIPMEIVPELLKKGKKIIDLSADFRFNDVSLYEACYQPHTAPDLLKKSVYGLSEVYADQIASADIIGNPGCYPTSVLLPLIPLIKSGLIETDLIVADSKSGVSGAGRSLSLTSHFCEVNESFKAYKIAAHRHNPEMDEVLSTEKGQHVNVTFVPHLVPMTRGMLSTIYTKPAPGTGVEEIRECLSSFYADSHFIRLCSDERTPDTLHVKGTNFCDIGFRMDKDKNCLILLSAIDNLLKGAAGQAVQNMNIILGIEETKGLLNVPVSL